MELHRSKFSLSTTVVWEYLSQGKDLKALYDNLPDELYKWVQKVIADLMGNYVAIVKACDEDYRVFDTRKETALYFKTKRYPSILFARLDGKEEGKMIWDMVRPKWVRPSYLSILEANN